MAFEQRRQHPGAIAVGGGGEVVEHGRATAETLGDHPGLAAQTTLQRGRPAILIGVARPPALRIGAIGEAVAIGENGLHSERPSQASIITGFSMRPLNTPRTSRRERHRRRGDRRKG